MDLASPALDKVKGEYILQVSFNASTFTAVPETEIQTTTESKK